MAKKKYIAKASVTINMELEVPFTDFWEDGDLDEAAREAVADSITFFSEYAKEDNLEIDDIEIVEDKNT